MSVLLWLFKQYKFLNARGEIQNLIDLFEQEICRIPPSGAGECCAPKLLQYAYLNHMQPLCMAEFWLGDSPQGEVRYDGEYYPACHAKCKPILRHMLQGLDVEENPLIPRMRMKAEKMKIIYEDAVSNDKSIIFEISEEDYTNRKNIFKMLEWAKKNVEK